MAACASSHAPLPGERVSTPVVANVTSEAPHEHDALPPPIPPDPEGDATPEELRRLLAHAGPLTDPPALVAGELRLPADWKTLPQSPVLMRRERGNEYAHELADGTLITTLGPGSWGAFDAWTGRALWSREVPHRHALRTYPVRGCDGVVVLVSEGFAIEGIEARTGRTRWRIPLTPHPGGSLGNVRPGQVRRHGCRVSVQVRHGRRTLGGLTREALDILGIDTRTGTTRVLTECPSGCITGFGRNDEGVLVIRDGAQYLARFDGTTQPLPPSSRYVVDHASVAVTYDYRARVWRGVSYTGRTLWERTRAFEHETLRVGDTLVSLGPDGVEALDMLTGEIRWALRLEPPLRELYEDELYARATDEGRVVFACRWSAARPILVLDGVSGRVESLRLGPRRADHIALEGPLLALGGGEGVVVTRVDREAPAIRTHLSLAEDLRRSIDTLLSGTLDGRLEEGFEHALYPPSADHASLWLGRLGSLANGALAEVIRGDDVAHATRALFALRPGEERDLVAETLRRHLDAPPTSELGSVIEAAGVAHGFRPLDPALAERLADAAIGWLREARRLYGGTRRLRQDCHQNREPRCNALRGLLLNVRVVRNLLARTATDPAPWRRLGDAIRRPARTRCTPNDAERATAAALAYLLELDLDEPLPQVFAEGRPCVHAATLRGHVRARDEPPTREFPQLVLEAREPTTAAAVVASEWHIHALQWGDPAWDTAPLFWIPYRLAGARTKLLVAKVGDAWRVVAEAGTIVVGGY
ncbi:MAG: PQQ-binding-like beta-propeller repeat protein [Myxococcota bacterium]